jgi:polysaccharide deacetylase family protein (PEP-CTERM system associated)
MKNALSFDIEDWFQVENMKSAIPFSGWDTLELRVVRNTERILKILRDSDTRATFFVLGWVAERCPALVKEIAGGGHELASHGHAHDLVYNLTPEQFREDIRKSKETIESITGKKIYGYRAPSFSITKESLWALDILKDEGYTYDSSIFPVSFHDRYGFDGCKTGPFRWPNGLMEVPLTVYRIKGKALPLAGGGYFRLLPYMYFKYFFKKINAKNERFTFYLHPWEIDPGQPRIKLPMTYRFRHYVNLKGTEGYLLKLLRDFRFDSILSAQTLKNDDLVN